MMESSDGWTGWFSGLLDESYRVGTAYGLAPDRLHKTPRHPSLGDAISFSTERGDPDVLAIPLDTELSELSLTGLGLIALDIDPERGFLYALTKHQPWIVVIDIRDDSDEESGEKDLNYLDIEAIIRVQTAAGADGFRQVLEIETDNGESLLYGLNDDPDSVFVLDLSTLEDDAFSDLIYDTQVGGFGTARDLASDEGLENTTNVGPGQMALHPDGTRLFVTNFNDNSVSVFDLTLGTHGMLVGTIPLVGENPYAIAISPDGAHAVVGNFTGEEDAESVAHSTLAVIDIDRDSSSYLEVLTWIVND
jgi:YVTN family beta-propeller protein